MSIAETLDAVVVGAGFGGMAAAIELKKLGMENFLVVEREDDLGGTWHVNRYPGAAVDIMSTTYQYWFEPNPRWKRLYAEGPELFAYAQHVSEKYDVKRHVRLNTAVVEAVWDDVAQLWHTTLSDGDTLTSRLLVNATGILSQRHYPDIPGLKSFEGEILHTTGWDAATDLRGRRVGVIGTGATAVQLLPEVAKVVDHLSVYQRTPIWVTPKMDAEIPERLQAVFAKVPPLHRLVRTLSNLLYQFVLMTAILNYPKFKRLHAFVEWQCRAMLALQVRDKQTRRKLTPTYSFGCKRPAVSNVYYKIYNQPHVTLETAGIDRIERDGILTRDGRRTRLDTLILATGFNIYDHNFPAFKITGRNRIDLGTWWRANRYASYEGITVPHFPNFICMTSPFAFTGLSFFDQAEQQTVHINRLLGEMRRTGSTTFEVSETAALQWSERAHTRMGKSLLFTGDCATSNSYYYNEAGDVCWFRPTSTRSAVRQQSRFPLTDYTFSSAAIQMSGTA